MIDSFKGKHAFLSNFYLIEIQFDGIIYNSVEHAYQASKTIDLSSRLMISKLETPGRAKRMGQLVPIRSDWEDVKVSIMTRLVGIKFGNSFLRKKLIKESKNEQLKLDL